MSSPIDAILGYGVVRPFRRTKNDFAATGGEALVRSAAGQILGTRASGETVEGEIPWRPEFGSKFYLLKHRKGSIVEDLALAFAREAFQKWEPRIRVTALKATFDSEQRATSIRIRLDMIDTNVPGNQVLIAGQEMEIPL